MTDNRNESLKRMNECKKIHMDEEIMDADKSPRGVYGIFVKDEKKCVYIGRSESIYGRMFGSDGHITNLMNHCHKNSQLNDAFKNDDTIWIKLLKTVPLKFDNYYKDMQRLASAECHFIDDYQEKDQCLEQVPEGKHMDEEEWKRKRKNK